MPVSSNRVAVSTPPGITQHLSLIALIIVFIVLAAAYNAANPIFEAPDEIWHYLYVRNLAAGRGLPYEQRKMADVLAQQEAAQPPLYYAVAAALTFWAPRGDVATLAIANPSAGIGDLWTDGNKNRFLHPSDQQYPWQGEVLTIHLVRLVSTAWGVLTILVTYAIGRSVFRSTTLATASAAAVAFNPQFIFMSSAVNNDVAIAATAGLLILLILRAAHSALSWRRSFFLGLVGGAVILAKPIAAGTLVLIALGIGISGRRAKAPLRMVGAHLIAAVATAALSSGWWFAYNVVTYGSLIPLQSFLGRKNLFDEMPTLADVLNDLTGLQMSYWAVFGWFNILAPPGYYRLFDGLMLLAAAGLVVLLIRTAIGSALPLLPPQRLLGRDTVHATPATSSRRLGSSAASRLDRVGIVLVVLWVLVVLAALMFYRLIVEAFQGRLIFGATGGIAVLLALGWSSLVPRRLGPPLAMFLAFTLIVPAALVPWRVIEPAYARPPVIEPSQAHPRIAVSARFGDEVQLLGIGLSPADGSVHPGEDLEVTLYLQGLRPMAHNYTLFLKILDPKGADVASVDSYPGRGELPTTFWEPGRVVVDRYRVHLAANAAAPSVDRLIVGMYWRPTMENLPSFGPNGRPLPGAVLLDQIVVRNPPDPDRVRGGVVFGQSIALVDYDLDRAIVRPGDPVTGYLLFGDVAPQTRDYTIFVHLMGDRGLLAQDDSPPAHGVFPTHYWRIGDVVRHRFHLPLPTDTAPGDYHLATGWYDLKSGERLGTPRGDEIRIGTVRVVAGGKGD